MRATRRLLASLAAGGVVAGVAAFAIASSGAGAPRATAAGGSVVVSPMPRSRTAAPATQISFLHVAPGAIGSVVVVGSRSGAHAGRLEPYSTGDGASFVPDAPFSPGETVRVRTDLPIVGAPSGRFSFVVSTPVAVHDRAIIPRISTSAPGTEHFSSAPGLTPPKLTVSGAPASLGPADLLLAPKGAVGSFGPMITTASGRLVYFRQLHGIEAMDLKVESYRHHPVLTWWQGKVLDGHGVGDDVIADRSYRTVATVHAGNGLLADLHEFSIINQTTALITAYAPIRWDMRPDGGPVAGTAWDGVVQEIDVPTGLVMYEWDALDHVSVANSDFVAPASASAPFDWFHINAVQALSGGRLLISSRNTSALYEVSVTRGGAIEWTLGGKASSFRMGPGTTFALQHDARLRAGGIVTVFDNERPPIPARALYLRLDMARRTVSLEHAYTHRPTVPTSALGDVEPLSHGRVFVSWGTSPYASVVSSSGRQLLDARLPGNDDSYRTYARVWHGQPRTKPSLGLSPSGSGWRVAMSWNGATAVASWRILAGAGPASLSPVATVADAGFETSATIGPAGAVAVEALGASGAVLAKSRTVPTPSGRAG